MSLSRPSSYKAQCRCIICGSDAETFNAKKPLTDKLIPVRVATSATHWLSFIDEIQFSKGLNNPLLHEITGSRHTGPGLVGRLRPINKLTHAAAFT